MQLNYVVVTSVDRDDLRDGGAEHFSRCIAETRRLNPDIKIEVWCLTFVDVWMLPWQF